MRSLLFVFLLLLLLLENLAAQTLEGRVMDEASGEGIAYANVGVVGKNVGTVSSAQGHFQIAIDSRYHQDTLRISAVGYQPYQLTVGDFVQRLQDDPTVMMTEAVTMMKEIVVKEKKYKGRKLKERVLGNTEATMNNETLFETNQLGHEMGVRVKVRRKPTFVQDFTVTLTENQYDTFKFRINFCSMKDGLPDRNLLNENIIVTSSQKKGPITVDLRDYNIVLENDVFVSMEWIEDLGGLWVGICDRYRFADSAYTYPYHQPGELEGR